MPVNITEMARDLNVNYDNDGDSDNVTVYCKSFNQALKVARQAIKYLKERGYKETGPALVDGAEYTDDANHTVAVALCSGREIQIRQY